MENKPEFTTILSVLFAVSLLVGLADGVYSYRLAKDEGTLQATVTDQGQTIQALSHHLDQAKEINKALEGEVTFTKQRLGTAQVELQKTQLSSSKLARQQREAKKQLSAQLGKLQEEEAATQGTVGNLSTDMAATKEGLNSTKQDLDATRSDLKSTMGDLGVQSGLIARNHDEIAELRLRGERDYYEFDLAKTKEPQRIGSNIAIGLRKADMKRQRYTISLVSDDHNIEKKDKTVNEPVQFYQAGYRQPTEIVVNQVYKNRIVGYVSVPKKKEARTAQSETGTESLKPRS